MCYDKTQLQYDKHDWYLVWRDQRPCKDEPLTLESVGLQTRPHNLKAQPPRIFRAAVSSRRASLMMTSSSSRARTRYFAWCSNVLLSASSRDFSVGWLHHVGAALHGLQVVHASAVLERGQGGWPVHGPADVRHLRFQCCNEFCTEGIVFGEAASYRRGGLGDRRGTTAARTWVRTDVLRGKPLPGFLG